MMLAQLLNIPKSPADWSQFSFHNQLDHQQIDQALAAKKSAVVAAQVIDPMPWGDISDWLARHQLLSAAESGYLSLPNYDFQSVDLRDPAQVEAWIWLHYLDHKGKHVALGI